MYYQLQIYDSMRIQYMLGVTHQIHLRISTWQELFVWEKQILYNVDSNSLGISTNIEIGP